MKKIIDLINGEIKEIPSIVDTETLVELSKIITDHLFFDPFIVPCNISLQDYHAAGMASNCPCGYYLATFNPVRKEWWVNPKLPEACDEKTCSAPDRIYDPYYIPKSPNGVDCAILCCQPNGSTLAEEFQFGEFPVECTDCKTTAAVRGVGYGAYWAQKYDGNPHHVWQGNGGQTINILNLKPDITKPFAARDNPLIHPFFGADTFPELLVSLGFKIEGQTTGHGNDGYFVGMYDSIFKIWHPCFGLDEHTCKNPPERIPDGNPSLIHGMLRYLSCSKP